MKLVPLVTVALAVVCASSTAQEVVGGLYEDAGFAPLVVGQELLTPTLRRQLQTGSTSTEAPSTPAPESTTATPTSAPPATTAPAPTTETPRTSAPAPTTATPTTSAPAPTTATPTEAPSTPEETTATPTVTESPSPSTATPDSPTETPSVTTSPPTATSAASSTSTDPTPTDPTPTTAASSSGGSSTSAPSATESTVSSSSGSTSSANADSSSGSSMSTGAVIGIVVGIVAAVAIIACIIMCAIRKRRDGDDDPLSPFELSMDKGYNPGVNAQHAYNQRAAGGAGVGGTSSGLEHTPPADAVAAGVAYSQFYDNAATSPDSMNRLESNVDSVPGDANATTNGTNLWLSAMEPKDNDSYLSAQESPRSSRNSSRNSYELSSNQAMDVDQSSQISGNSNKGSDFPDHHEDNDSARGSYEL